MRCIGQIDSENAAQQFSDFLYVQNITNEIQQGDGGWDIWVHSDDDLTQASQWLQLLRSNPADERFAEAIKAKTLRKEQERNLQDYRRRVRTRGRLFQRFVAYRVGPVTLILIAISVWICFRSSLGHNLEPVRNLLFSEVRAPDFGQRLLAAPEIRSGQLWRLITPIFLHFGIIHILFNMLWLRDLGGMIETVEGAAKLVVLVFVSAAISNWAQYLVTGHPLFGGMSGVVYSLLGYVWMKGKFHPGSGLFLHKQTVVMMLIWLVVCFTGLLGPIANYAHLAGLVVGVVWGFAETRRT